MNRTHVLIWIGVVALTGCGGDVSDQSRTLAAPQTQKYLVRLDSTKDFRRKTDFDAQRARWFHHAFPGFATTLTLAEATQLRSEPGVVSVIPAGKLSLATADLKVQRDPPWNLDKLDERQRGANRRYSYRADGSGVRAYVVDTGIDATHPDFQGRAVTAVDLSADVGTSYENQDTHGHGTHVAGILGSATYGVAKGATLAGIKLFDHKAEPISDEILIAGIDWAIADHKAKGGAAVMNISIAGEASDAVDTAVRSAVESGIVVVVAAGNSNQDACNGSPSREPVAITVAATMLGDQRAFFSNWGPCVDLLAPGNRIVSTARNGGSQELSGTSMASPHVAGLAALYLSTKPSESPAQVAAFLNASAIKDLIIGLDRTTPNLTASAYWNAQ